MSARSADPRGSVSVGAEVPAGGILLPPSVLDAIRRHAERGYPHEVCGFLLGEPDSAARRFTVRTLLPAENRRADLARTRYLIDPEAYRVAEREAAALGLDIAGFYHSHPDAPACPSEFDREHGWPSIAYVIVTVGTKGAGEATGWILADDRSRFVSLALEHVDHPIPEPAS
ncbi:MAG: Mov34/MPN/PAD-1 family protein [Gemmatimonadota bacterium]